MRNLGIVAAVVALTTASTAHAGTITAVGAVKALTNVNQMLGTVGTGNFDEGPTSGNVPAGVYSATGLTWRSGTLTSILPGVTNTGTAFLPQYGTWTYFPAPIGGGGTHNGQSNNFAGVATFSNTITQVGLTASTNGTQYLTAWNASGMMIGQVTWQPASDSAFVGIDTLGVPIAMIAYGNDDLWAGTAYNIGGSTIISDSWIWATGKCSSNSDCNDSNACTTDTCGPTGACTNASSVTCTPLDQCHVAGVCQPATGTCTNPNQMDGNACNDGNACTQTDTCQTGVCTGSNNVTCTALDGCHDAGTCNPVSGTCSNPAKMDGAACSDANACTQTDTCQAGVCSGMNPVLCAPPDQCHVAGTCDAASGMCSNPAKMDGTSCDDSNKCTQNDMCQAGTCAAGTPVTCSASDQCHEAGMCDPSTGTCSNPNKMDGSTCNDNDKCTTVDTCNAGACVGGTPVTCSAVDSCHEAGSCDPATGSCSSPAKPDGTPCPVGVCTAGKCGPTETSSTTSSGSAGGNASTSTSSTTSGAGGGGGDGSSGTSKGCGCREAGGDDSESAPYALFVVSGLAITLARRAKKAG